MGRLALTSPEFVQDRNIPSRFTCAGFDLSPELSWAGTPAGTKTFALIVSDPDATHGTFIHWVIYNLPASRTNLPQRVEKRFELTHGGEQGTNSFGNIGYGGPCPPPGKLHHYHFKLYALNTKLKLKPGATAVEVEKAMKGQVIATSDLVGVFERR
ncbi:MAG: YbhB/YbcL family Raf kinase inhibitor-like protein [Candidatus Binataceae bacterium]